MLIDNFVSYISIPTTYSCTSVLTGLFKDYLQNNPDQFFDWDMKKYDFLRNLTFKTHEKSIFKNYKENSMSLAWGSINI